LKVILGEWWFYLSFRVKEKTMSGSSIIDFLPLWLFYLIVSAIVLLVIEAGWHLGNYRRQRAEDEKTPVNAAVGATLGLLAFLLAFTFSMAATRFDSRKLVILNEANAIGTTYLRTSLLPDPLGEQARSLLREYTVIRAGGRVVIMSEDGMTRSAALQDQLWAIAAEVGAQSSSYTTGLFIQSLNEMIDLDEVRITANRNRIPDSIWLMLGVVTIFSMAAIGFQFGLTGARSWVVIILLLIAFTTVITMIADLDRSQGGIIRVSQQPLMDLLSKIGTPAP
jgi:hypothetical protein